MLGTFFPWNARTLVVCWLSPAVPSGGGIWRCRWSCCRSFVVVILVNKPATISMMSETGMSLISYWGPTSVGSRRCRRDRDRVCENALFSSVAKLRIWERLVTLIRRGEGADEWAGDRSEFAGEGWTGVDPDEGTGRGMAKVPEGGFEPLLAGGCDCGRKDGLDGIAGC
jgi:hypothetical protein